MTDPRPEPERAEGPRDALAIARDALAAARAEARRRGFTRSAAGRTPAAPPGTGRAGASRRSARRAAADQRSGAYPDDRDPQLLASSLDRLVADRGWETDAAVGGVMGRWGAIVGPALAAHCTPVGFDDGELVLQAASTAWATELRLLAPRLVSRLNDELGQATVSRIRVLGPVAPSWLRGPLRVRGRGPRDTYG